MNTHVNIVVILGLMFIALGCPMMFISGEEILRNVRGYYTFGSEDVVPWNWNRLNDVEPVIWIFFVFGILFFIFGMGLLAKAKWTQRASNFLMVGALLGWTYMVMEIWQHSNRYDDYLISTGVTVVGYTTFIFLSLFLKNEKVLMAYSKDFEEYKNDDILDA